MKEKAKEFICISAAIIVGVIADGIIAGIKFFNKITHR